MLNSNVEPIETVISEVVLNKRSRYYEETIAAVAAAATKSVTLIQQRSTSAETNAVQATLTAVTVTKSVLTTPKAITDTPSTIADVAVDYVMEYTMDNMFRDQENTAEYFNNLMEVPSFMEFL